MATTPNPNINELCPLIERMVGQGTTWRMPNVGKGRYDLELRNEDDVSLVTIQLWLNTDTNRWEVLRVLGPDDTLVTRLLMLHGSKDDSLP